jgi:hypothetical protein
MTDLPGSAPWAIRMALIAGGSYLAGRGIGDAALWAEVVPAVLAIGGAVWSWFSRKRPEPR